MQAHRAPVESGRWPVRRTLPGGRHDEIVFRVRRGKRYVASMRQRIDLARIYRQALQRVPETIDGQAPHPVPDVCPWPLDDLLSDEP